MFNVNNSQKCHPKISIWRKIVLKMYHENRNDIIWVFSMENNIWHEIMYVGCFFGGGGHKKWICVGGILFLGKEIIYKKYIYIGTFSFRDEFLRLKKRSSCFCSVHCFQIWVMRKISICCKIMIYKNQKLVSEKYPMCIQSIQRPSYIITNVPFWKLYLFTSSNEKYTFLNIYIYFFLQKYKTKMQYFLCHILFIYNIFL